MTRAAALLGTTVLLLVPVAVSAQSFVDYAPQSPQEGHNPWQPETFMGNPSPSSESWLSLKEAGGSEPAGMAGTLPGGQPSDGCGTWGDWFCDKKDRLWNNTCEFAGLVGDDYKNYYSCDNFFRLGVAFIVAAPLANTSVDQNFRDWYQRDVRSSGTDNFATAMKQFGEYRYAIPVYVVATVGGRCFDDTPTGSCVHDWGQRSLRALAVGAPAVGVMQYVTGASRPGEGSSHWRPFQDNNGVSGHAFVGSIPFLTAASMTENPFGRYTLIAVSALPAWSRINDDAHYLSQATLGWCMGCAAVLSVNQTEWQRHNIQVLPITPSGEPGVGVMISY